MLELVEIKKFGPFDFDILMNEPAFWRFEKEGYMVGPRWDMENKVFLHRMDKIPHLGEPGYDELRAESWKKIEHAVYDRSISDIHIYIPHAVLKHALVGSSLFSPRLGNMKILPDDETSMEIGKECRIRVVYSPSSVDILDMNRGYGRDW